MLTSTRGYPETPPILASHPLPTASRRSPSNPPQPNKRVESPILLVGTLRRVIPERAAPKTRGRDLLDRLVVGGFRAEAGGATYARIAGFVSTIRKHQYKVVEQLANVLQGRFQWTI